MKKIIAPLVILLASCSSGSSKSDDILYQKLSDADALVIEVDNAINLADTNTEAALGQLWDLCDQAEAFTQSLYGTPNSTNQYSDRYGTGWEYPGDVPDKYSDALWTPIYACALYDPIKEGHLTRVSEYIAQFRVGYRCIRSGICDELSRIAP